MGNVGVATVLVEYGADVNAAAIYGSTPLHTAASRGTTEFASWLLTKEAAVDALDGDSRTPLMPAAFEGHVAATHILLTAGADVTIRDEGRRSALDKAAQCGHVDVLRAIIEHGVDVDAVDSSNGFTALHLAATFDETAAIEMLIGAGADIEAGMGALFYAAYMSNVSAVVVLLKHGACVSKQSRTGEIPLHKAASKAGRLGTAQVVDLLLRYGADEKAISSSDGLTPADVVGCKVEEQDSLAEDVERVRNLLANAAADRAWRRRGFLVVCRAHYPGGRVQLWQGSSHADAGIAKKTRNRARASRSEAEWAGVASMLMGGGVDPISLMGDGADIIFETTVGFL